jgi:acetoin utilization deacetylase AcuC-like enzyme
VADLIDGIEKATDKWEPELVLISAGFDAMDGDPLGGFTLEPEDYGKLTSMLKKMGCPIASILEGGYAPARIAKGVLAHLVAMGSPIA